MTSHLRLEHTKKMTLGVPSPIAHSIQSNKCQWNTAPHFVPTLWEHRRPISHKLKCHSVPLRHLSAIPISVTSCLYIDNAGKGTCSRQTQRLNHRLAPKTTSLMLSADIVAEKNIKDHLHIAQQEKCGNCKGDQSWVVGFESKPAATYKNMSKCSYRV